jgi:transcriptional regulator with XRE-family HTH domain
MGHTKATQRVSLNEAMSRLKARRLTQLDVELASGVDRTRISRLCRQADPRVLLDTYEKLDDALRKLGALRAGERLVFGQTEAWAS